MKLFLFAEDFTPPSDRAIQQGKPDNQQNYAYDVIHALILPWVLIVALFLPVCAHSQVINTRWDAQSTTTTGTGQMLPVLALPGVQVQFFTGCTVLPCTTPATTYQSVTSSTACPSTAQIVWQLPIAKGCVGTADSQGNFGGWFIPGAYQYVITVSGISAGPYSFNVGAGSGGGASNPPVYSVQFASNLTGSLGSDPNITINPTAHSLTVSGAGTGSIGLTDSISSHTVTQTVQPGTASWTFSWPLSPPVLGNTCLSVAATGAGSAPGCILGSVPSPTIAAALTAAGTTGPVIIPGSYAGTDTISSNPSGVAVTDERPISGATVPIQHVSAAQYGATCKGIAAGGNDTAAINNALSATYAYNQQVAAKTPFVIDLPQGSCVVTAPIEMGVYASLVGLGTPTTIACNYAAWTSSDYNCVEYTYNAGQPPISGVANRRLENLTIAGLNDSTLPEARGISIINTANNPEINSFPFSNLYFHNMTVTGFDVGIYAEDWANSVLDMVTIVGNRIGMYLNGNDVAITVSHSSIIDGSWLGTSQHLETVGVLETPNNKYSGGTVSAGPQGFTMDGGSFIGGFNYDVDQQQCIRCQYLDSTIDEAGAQPQGCVTSCVFGNAFLIGENGTSGGLWIANNWIGVVQGLTNGIIIYSQANAVNASSTGLWIDKNYILVDSGTDTTTDGIVMAGTATGPFIGGHITDNTFSNMGSGIILDQGFENSIISGNQGFSLATTLINLDGTSGGLGQNNTQVFNNTDVDIIPVIIAGSASGYLTGFNQSGAQLTGTFLASGPGCTISAGTIGTTCTPTNITLPVTFANTSYTIAACSIQGGGGANAVSNTTVVDTSHIQVTETALTAAATGGGTIRCTVNHI